MKKTLIAAAALAACGYALAKIPAPVLDDAAKAKAAEAAAKTAWQGKVDAYKLCQAQDRAVAAYRKGGKADAAAPTPTGVAPCSDPGPFAYAPPEQKPLETSGAHSPAPTAANPPSVKANSAEMTTAPAKK